MDGRLRPRDARHHAIARTQRRAPFFRCSFGRRGRAGDFRPFLLWYTGRRPGPGECSRSLMCSAMPGAVCVGVVSGSGPGSSPRALLPRLSGSAWLFWPWPRHDLCGGRAHRPTVSQQRATETERFSAFLKNHGRKSQVTPRQKVRWLTVCCLNFSFMTTGGLLDKTYLHLNTTQNQ